MSNTDFSKSFKTFANLVNNLFMEANTGERAVTTDHDGVQINVKDKLTDLNQAFEKCCVMDMSGLHHHLVPAPGFAEYLVTQDLKINDSVIDSGVVVVTKEGRKESVVFWCSAACDD